MLQVAHDMKLCDREIQYCIQASGLGLGARVGVRVRFRDMVRVSVKRCKPTR